MATGFDMESFDNIMGFFQWSVKRLPNKQKSFTDKQVKALKVYWFSNIDDFEKNSLCLQAIDWRRSYNVEASSHVFWQRATALQTTDSAVDEYFKKVLEDYVESKRMLREQTESQLFAAFQ